MTLVVRIKPRALREIDRAAEWWSRNRPAAPRAIESDLKDALSALVEQPGIGSKVVALIARARAARVIV